MNVSYNQPPKGACLACSRYVCLRLCSGAALARGVVVGLCAECLEKVDLRSQRLAEPHKVCGDCLGCGRNAEFARVAAISPVPVGLCAKCAKACEPAPRSWRLVYLRLEEEIPKIASGVDAGKHSRSTLARAILTLRDPAGREHTLTTPYAIGRQNDAQSEGEDDV